MCTHTTTHHVPCFCISTRTTTPCTETKGARYRGPTCPAFEHVKLFVSASDPDHCLRHPNKGDGDQSEVARMSDGSPKRRGSRDIGVKSEVAGKIDEIPGEEDNLSESNEEFIDGLIRKDSSRQSNIFRIIKNTTAKAKPPPQTPPPRRLKETRTNSGHRSGADTTSQASIYSDSDDSFHHLDSPHNHTSHSSLTSSDPFSIQTPKSSNASFTPQTSFSADGDGDVIYGGTSLLDVPIDGTKWNWNGRQWIGTRAIHVAGFEDEMEFVGF